jgi:hypothetical protein
VKQSTWDQLDEDFRRFPTLRGQGAGTEAIAEAQKQLGVRFDPDLVAFLSKYGSAIVGAYDILGVSPAPALGNGWSLVDNTKRIRAENWPGVGNAIIISFEGDGSPIGITEEGKVVMSDHLTGRPRDLASSFEEFLLLCLHG